MRNIIGLLISLFFCMTCHPNKNFTLEYLNKNDKVTLAFKNNTEKNIIFLVPNQLQFADKHNGKITLKHDGTFYPITIFAEIIQDKKNKLYQDKLDSIFVNNLKYSSELNYEPFNTVMIIKKKSQIKINYSLTVKKNISSDYSSDYIQKYEHYEKIIKGNYPQSNYLKMFSKLNFKDAKFVAQPMIEDSLILKISR